MQIIEAIQYKDYAGDFLTAQSIVNSIWHGVKPCALDIRDAIETINSAGGVAILAHPTQIREKWLEIKDIQPLSEAGLGGIEVYHPSLDPPAQEHFKAIAEKLSLVISGGSDEHGFPSGFTRLGRQPVTESMLSALKQRARALD